MTTTNFQTGTVIESSWLNEVDQVVHDADGAAYVDYTPQGAGVVTRDVQSKLRESVSVKDFGAVGDGVTDDTNAINSAIAWANDGGKKTIYFPDGIYLISSTLDPIVADNVALVGSDSMSVSIKVIASATGVSNILDFGDTTNMCQYSSIYGFTFDYTGVSLTATDATIRHINTNRCYVEKIRFRRNASTLQLGSNTGATTAYNSRFNNCVITSDASYEGKALDLQSWATFQQNGNTFGAINTTTGAFRGIYMHPAATSIADNTKNINCEWNYPGVGVQYILDADGTNNNFSSVMFTNCVFDQSENGSNIYIHIDSGALSTSRVQFQFSNCTSNAADGSKCIKVDNTGAQTCDVVWNGGHLTCAASGYIAELVAGEAHLTITGTYISNRSTTNAAAAVLVQDGASGLILSNNNFARSDSAAASFNSIVRFIGDSDNIIVTGNSSKYATRLASWVAGAPIANPETYRISNNLVPENMLTFRVTTTDDTPTVLSAITLPEQGLGRVTARVMATTGVPGSRAYYEVSGLYYRPAAGSTTLQGSLYAPVTVEQTAGMDLTLTISGNDIQLVATGVAATTIDWVFDFNIDRGT